MPRILTITKTPRNIKLKIMNTPKIYSTIAESCHYRVLPLTSRSCYSCLKTQSFCAYPSKPKVDAERFNMLNFVCSQKNENRPQSRNLTWIFAFLIATQFLFWNWIYNDMHILWTDKVWFMVYLRFLGEAFFCFSQIRQPHTRDLRPKKKSSRAQS